MQLKISDKHITVIMNSVSQSVLYKVLAFEELIVSFHFEIDSNVCAIFKKDSRICGPRPENSTIEQQLVSLNIHLKQFLGPTT